MFNQPRGRSLGVSCLLSYPCAHMVHSDNRLVSIRQLTTDYFNSFPHLSIYHAYFYFSFPLLKVYVDEKCHLFSLEPGAWRRQPIESFIGSADKILPILAFHVDSGESELAPTTYKLRAESPSLQRWIVQTS